MEKKDLESLRTKIIEVDPFFQLKQVKLLTALKVKHELEKNVFKSRVLVLATHGVFLYNNKHKTIKLIEAIPFTKLISIQIEGIFAIFSSSTNIIKVKNDEIASFALLTLCIRKAQIHPRCLPLTMRYPQELAAQVEAQDSTPYSNDVFGDRIVTCAYTLGVTMKDEELEELHSLVSFDENNFTITREILENKFKEVIIMTLAFDYTLTELCLKEISLENFFNCSSSLFSFGCFIEKITFDSCTYENCTETLKKLLYANHLLSPHRLTFENMKGSNSFVSFFEEIPKLTNEVVSLEFSLCTLTNNILSNIFQEILFNDCYQSLHELKLNNITCSRMLNDEMCSLLSTDWINKEGKLKTVELCNCNLDSSSLIVRMASFKTPINVLRLRNSNAELLIDIREKTNFSQLKLLDFRNSLFSSQNLISLMEMASNQCINIRGLDLSCIRIFPPVLKDILEHMSSEIIIDSLETLFFDGNLMNAQELHYFTKFISLHKNIKNLSVNGSISAKESSVAVCEFFDVVCNMEKLESFSMRGDGSINLCCGDIITPYLPRFAAMNLKHIDLTNQGIGAEGITKLEEILNGSNIRSFLFDGVITKTPKDLIEFCRKVILSNCKYSHWPYESFKRFDNPISFSKRIEFDQESVENLKAEFLYSFGEKSIFPEEDDDKISLERTNWIVANTETEEVVEKEEKTHLPEEVLESLNILTKDDPELSDLISECVGVNDNEHTIVKALGSTFNKFSNERIMQMLGI